MKLFGREPTLWIGTLSAILSFAVTFNTGYLSGNQAALWVTGVSAVSAVVAALHTRPIAPQVFTYAVSAISALTAAYGFDWGSERIGTVNGLVLAVLVLLTRGQVSPAGEAFRTGVLGDKVTTNGR